MMHSLRLLLAVTLALHFAVIGFAAHAAQMQMNAAHCPMTVEATHPGTAHAHGAHPSADSGETTDVSLELCGLATTPLMEAEVFAGMAVSQPRVESGLPAAGSTLAFLLPNVTFRPPEV